MNFKIEIITTVNNFALHKTNVNNILLNIPPNNIRSVENYAVGNANNTRYITTITYL